METQIHKFVCSLILILIFSPAASSKDRSPAASEKQRKIHFSKWVSSPNTELAVLGYQRIVFRKNKDSSYSFFYCLFDKCKTLGAKKHSLKDLEFRYFFLKRKQQPQLFLFSHLLRLIVIEKKSQAVVAATRRSKRLLPSLLIHTEPEFFLFLQSTIGNKMREYEQNLRSGEIWPSLNHQEFDFLDDQRRIDSALKIKIKGL